MPWILEHLDAFHSVLPEECVPFYEVLFVCFLFPFHCVLFRNPSTLTCSNYFPPVLVAGVARFHPVRFCLASLFST